MFILFPDPVTRKYSPERHRSMQRILFVWLLIAVLCLAALPAAAQESRGAITGQISDPSGAALGGANVVIANIETGAVTRLVTNDIGAYLAPLLQPGLYRLEVERSGFKRAVK